MADNPIVTIEMEDGGKIVAELYPDVAPISVNNFVSLINKGFYDGIIFHRVISGFMIQGATPRVWASVALAIPSRASSPPTACPTT